MNFGTPTPEFFAILAILLLTFAVASIGLTFFPAFLLGAIASYVTFVAMVSGFRDSSSVAMAAGWGILVMIPTALGAAVAAALGRLLHRVRARRQEEPN